MQKFTTNRLHWLVQDKIIHISVAVDNHKKGLNDATVHQNFPKIPNNSPCWLDRCSNPLIGSSTDGGLPPEK